MLNNKINETFSDEKFAYLINRIFYINLKNYKTQIETRKFIFFCE